MASKQKTKAKQNTKKEMGSEGIYDASKLGIAKMLLLGIQHTFAMFGATVLVPLLTGLSISTTLLMAGLGTLLFHFITKRKVPAFLGSSFAFIGGYAAVAPMKDAAGNALNNAELLPYACLGVAAAGLVYFVLSALVKAVGVNKVMRFFPPVVTGPIIISIGLILAPTAINSASGNWLLASIALGTIIICNIWGKGMVKIIPIIIGVVVSYIAALCMGAVDFEPVKQAAWVGLPITWSQTVFGGVDFKNPLVISSIIAIVPISLATMMEHIGDISAIGATCKENFIKEPGLNRTLMGDGLATTLASLFGGPANTTYGENTGVLALTKVYDPKVIRIAACFAVILSFSPKFAAIISTIPTPIIGGVSLILYGMISAVGVRNVVESKVDFTVSRNLIVSAVILVTALGFSGVGGVTITVFGASITLSGLAIAAILGIALNAIFPGNSYVFDDTEGQDTGVSFEV